jgi:putative copper resistance protein D
MDSLLVAMRFVQFLAMMILFGAALYPYYALDHAPGGRSARTEYAAFLQRVALVAGVCGLISAIVWLGVEAAEMSGDTNAWHDAGTIATILNKTEFGRIWRWRLVGLILLPATLIWRMRANKAPSTLIPLLFGLVLLTGLAGVGHGAMGLGFGTWVHLGNQAVHFVAASVWVGGLYPLYRTLARADYELAIKRQALHRFSAVGLAAVLLIVASGLLNSWFVVESIHALLFTLYGRLLLLKVLFFLSMVALALVNRLFLMPRLDANAADTKSLGLLLRTVVAEFVLAVLVVATVSLLGNLPPAMDRMVM